MNKILNKFKILTLLLLVFLAACSSNKPTGEVSTAAIPLNDLNLVKSKIPPVLVDARTAPYAVPSEISCDSLNGIITSLDEVLPADVDATIEEKSKTKKAASNALSSAIKNLVPGRGWLRKLSGAERHSKKVAKAIAAGTIRRAFIKWIKSTKQCPTADQSAVASKQL